MSSFNNQTTFQTVPLRSRCSLGLIAAIGLCAGLGVSLSNAQEINDQGWTVLEPSVDTRFVFVSSSTGNDSNSGFSPSQAVKTFDRAKELMRDDSADWMLLKRGDVWHEGIGAWRISGRSGEERVVISSYGESSERPKIYVTDESAIASPFHQVRSNLAIMGISMVSDRPDESGATGIRWLSTGENLLIEDCYIEGFKDNVTCQASGGEFTNFALRRSVIVDSWSTSGHSQGLFIVNTTGVVIEENVFDHNGWNEEVAGADPSVFNQNVYIQKGVTGVEFLGNITSRASAAGVQMRSGGQAVRNLIYANGLGIRFGYRTIDWPTEMATGSLIGNVVLGGQVSIIEGSGIGMWIERAADTVVQNNVVANHTEGSLARAYTLNGHARDVEFIGNVAYEWVNSSGAGNAFKASARAEGTVLVSNNKWHMPGTNRLINIWYGDNYVFSRNEMFGFEASENSFVIGNTSMNYAEWIEQENVEGDELEASSFPDPGRDIDGYARHLGYIDGDVFLMAARSQHRLNWDTRLTGGAAADWIRAGYIVQE